MLRDFLNQEVSMKKGVVALMILGLLATTSVTGFLLANDNRDIIISRAKDQQHAAEAETNGEKASENSDVNKEPVEEIKVYVVGEVNKPGVVTIKKGQIIQDAIELAGGPTQDADIENINLAYELQENVMIRIMSKNEGAQQDADEGGGMQAVASEGNTVGKSVASGSSSSKGASAKTVSGKTEKNSSGSAASKNNSGQNNQSEAAIGITITKDSGGAVIGENESKNANNSTSDTKININTATVDQLDSLPGIGPSIAAKIVAYREQNGDFKAIEDIMNVSGIGQSKFNNIKDFITVK
ncbi:helix-hairpin-helix domain-containing protein [Acetivibrio straminisolvens]|uniref:Competence protein n=1 Tax=Acetivibrio straminisolvens JCM 21531 TaxID=1294263 RepID=W4VCR3_9FIRM|nr:helix-hairpin-helix domain-containing protein [Acetivibrio straminisolvens]GAE90588.1 competence protein [Acetivibrio straminisolvens JCM 21531]